MLSLSIVFLTTLAIYVQSQPGISYPKDQCDWIGGDGMHGAYLPIGVCKHIFDPHNLTTPTDDHRYSHKYVCLDDGTVKAHAYGNTNCQGETGELDVRTYGDDYYNCNSGHGACPYAVVRFHHQEAPDSDQCIKSSDGWYSEAPMTTYQCLNITKNGINEWYMLKCTEDGKGLIGIDFTENCEQKLNESVMYDGCNYKDLWVQITHCEYWDETTVPFIRDITTSTSTTQLPMTSTSTIPVTNGILTTILSQSSSTQIVESSSSDHYHHHHHGPKGPKSGSHSHEHRYGSHSHDGYHDHHNADSQEVNEEREISWPLWFHVAVGVALLFMILCCCMAYKYMKQKRQMRTFAKIIEFTQDIEGADRDDVNMGDNTVVMDEGETITFK